jgi:hypothetical protein
MVRLRHITLTISLLLSSFHLQARICTDPSCDCIVTVASSQVGNCEEGGNNRGQHVEKYLRSVNAKPGDAWCSAFVAWVLNVCGVTHKINAWSPTAVSRNVIWQRGEGEEPQGGDVFGIYYTSLKRVGHAGIIERWGSYVHTIEGNTNDGGSRDGDCVMRKIRHHKTIYKVSRYR